MNIVVCIKQVPDTKGGVKFNPDGTLDRASMLAIMNPDDKAGLEAALRIKDETGAKVTVLTMGLPKADDMLREALAMGADEAVLVTDRRLGGADTWATSSTVAAAVKKLDYDLIITGRQAIDGDTAQVGPQIAEKLNLPQVTYVEEFEMSKDMKEITVHRQLEDGYELIKIKTPCMLTCIKELNTPRYMTIPGIFGAKDKPMDIWNAKDVNVDLATVGLEASPTNVYRSFTPAPKGKGVTIEGDSEKDLAKNLLIALKGKHAI